MSEEAKSEIGEWQASDDGSHIYSDDFTHDAMLVLSGDFGSVAKRKRYADQIAHDLSEAAALRAALDQERADNERLRACLDELRQAALYAPQEIDAPQLLDQLWNHEVVFTDGEPTALLSGRGNGGNDG